MARKAKSAENTEEIQPELNLIAENDAAPVEIVVESKTDEEKPVVGADEGIDVLRERLQKAKEHLAAEKQARLEAEKLASRASVEVKENQVHLVTNAIDILNRERDIIKHNIKELMAAGDYDRVVDLQEMLSVNNSKLMELENGLQEMKNQPAPQQPKAPEPDDIVENLIRQVSPRSARWLDRNRDNLNSVKALRIMERAHGDALDNDIEPDSDEYFKFIEKRLGIGKAPPKQQVRYEMDDDEDQIMSSAAEPTSRRSAPPAAPVSRSSQMGHNSRTITLTADQAEAARISGLTNQQYWELMQREKERSTSH